MDNSAILSMRQITASPGKLSFSLPCKSNRRTNDVIRLRVRPIVEAVQSRSPTSGKWLL